MFLYKKIGHKKLLCLLTLTLLSATFAKESTQHLETQDRSYVNMRLKQPEARLSNSCIGAKVADGLIEKGYQLLRDIINNGKDLNTIDNKIEFFEDGGSKYSTGYLQHVPTVKNCISGATKMYDGLWSSMGYKMTHREKLVEQEKLKTLSRRAKLESLICVIWALTDHATKSGQPFDSGSFSIIDPESGLFNLFEKYATFANDVSTLEELPYGVYNCLNPNGNSFAYNRSPTWYSSSHYKQTTIWQIGIDARFESNAYALPILPYGMTHILVGRVLTSSGLYKTFVKYEPNGTGDIYSSSLHLLDFKHSMSDTTKKRSEKYFHSDITDKFMSFGELLSKKDISSFLLSEDVSPKMKSMAMNLIEHPSSLSDENGIQYDFSSFIELSEHIQNVMKDEEIQTYVKELFECIKGLYPENSGNLMYRTGDEVVLNLSSIVNTALQPGGQ